MARKRRNNNRKSKSTTPSASQQMEVVPTKTINTQKFRTNLCVFLTGTNLTPATASGYAYLPVTSTLWGSAAGYTALQALFLKVRPISCIMRVTFNRATGSSDNPRVAFCPTPDGQPVGNLGMNLSTFESPLASRATGGPGVTIRHTEQAMIAISAYNTVTNGYQMARPSALSVRGLPLVYYADILFYTPGINLTTVPQYVQINLEFCFEWSHLRTDLA